MPPEEMTGSTHILEFMCYANSRFRRDKIPHGNGDVIFFRCFGSATPETDIELFPPAVSRDAVAVVRSPPKFVAPLVVLRRTTERV